MSPVTRGPGSSLPASSAPSRVTTAAALGSVVLAVLAGCFQEPGRVAGPAEYPVSVAGLEPAQPAPILDLADGDTLVLEAAPVKKTLQGVEVRMLGYNGSIPGPVIRVRQGSSAVIRVRNRTGFPTSLHSHGIRMDFEFDGAGDANQPPIAHGKSFDYRLKFPDAGLFWYHPHVREDYSQEMGLYGNIQVLPADSAYWPPVDREQILMLDDFFLDPDRKTAPFRTDEVDRTMMGRFGNLFLINGDTTFHMTVKRKERVRFYGTNTCNTRVFNIGFADSALTVRKIKVIGSDNGQYEHFDTASSTLLAPSERKIFEAYFDRPGTYYLTHRMLRTAYNPDSTLVLGRVTVLADSVETGYGDTFLLAEGSAATRKSVDSVRSLAALSVPPAKELLLTGVMRMSMKRAAAQGEPISIEAKGIEWLDHMAAMNEISNRQNMRWAIRDVETGLENHQIRWTFKRGDKVKIRIRNDTAATHPMPHPVHFHGQRFLVTAVNGRRNLNMAWKDTYLVGTGETTDILLDAANPGVWMAHCHIAEHHESMMMFHFTVE